MKPSITFLLIVSIAVSCSRKNKENDNSQVEIITGTYYLNFELSNDTLRFQSKKYGKREWNRMQWSITKDSIFQRDSRGLSFYFGEDRRKYTFKNDTLKLFPNMHLKDAKRKKRVNTRIEQYLVVKSTKNYLELVDLAPINLIDTTNRIRSKIQLR